MSAQKNDFLADVKAIQADVRDPLTVEELRNRLKHIASLCWGLSIDLSTEMSECERVRKENEQLRAQVKFLGGRLPSCDGKPFDPVKWAAMSPEEQTAYIKRFKRARYVREYRARKAKEQQTAAAYAGGSDGND